MNAFLTLILVCALAAQSATPKPAGVAKGQTDSFVAEAPGLRFHSAFWINLHHVLYAAAWARRPEAGTLKAHAGALPSPLEAPLTDEERIAWIAAVDYYATRVADHDLLFGLGMAATKQALAADDLSSPGIGKGLRTVLQAAEPVYRKHWWPAHDRANRAWITDVAPRVTKLAPVVTPRLASLYRYPWFTTPVRVDVLWVGSWSGAYTTVGPPPHVTIDSGDKDTAGWAGADTVFHEVSHVLVEPVTDAINVELRDAGKRHRDLWHVVQFYLTGEVVRQALAGQGVTYTPYMYATGLIDRAWSRYRTAVETNWLPYVNGKTSLEQAITDTVAALP